MIISSSNVVGYMQDVAYDILAQTTSWVEEAFIPQSGKTTMSGFFYVPGLASRLGRGLSSGYAPGEEIKESVSRILKVAYECTRRSGLSIVPDEIRNDLAAVGVDSATLNGIVESVIAEALIQRSLAGVTLVTDTVQFSQTATMTSLAGDDITGGSACDLAGAYRTLRTITLPGADKIILPAGDAVQIAGHPQVTGKFVQNTEGAADWDDFELVKNWLRRAAGFREVVVVDDNYNSAVLNASDDVSKAFAGGTQWIGYSNALHMVKPTMESQDRVDMDREIDAHPT